MKKLLLATAVAAVIAVPTAVMADTTLYGQFRYSFSSIDDPDAGNDGLKGLDNVSLFGLKGSAGKDVKAFFHIQTGAPSDKDADGRAFKQRFYFAGLSGGFGKVKFGRMTNAYKLPGFKLDPFYNMTHISAGGSFNTGGATYGLSPATNGFTDNSLEYISPSFGGLKINVGFYVDDSNADEHGSNFGVSYKNGPFNAGVQVASNGTVATVPNVAADGDALRVYGGYGGKSFSAALSYEQVDVGALKDVGYIYFTGSAKVAAKTKLSLSFGSVDDGPAKGTGITAGVFQTVAPKAQLFLTYATADLDDAAKEDPSAISVGAIYKF